MDKFQKVWKFFKEKFLIKPVSLKTLPLENFTVKGRDLYKWKARDIFRDAALHEWPV